MAKLSVGEGEKLGGTKKKRKKKLLALEYFLYQKIVTSLLIDSFMHYKKDNYLQLSVPNVNGRHIVLKLFLY